MSTRAGPVDAQLVAMRGRPLSHEPYGPRRKIAGEDLKRIDLDRRFVPA